MTVKQRYVIVRGISSGCFAGYFVSRTGSEVTLINARRLWYWDGAATLSQLAEDGTSKPDTCKFPTPVSRIEILDAIEILEVSDIARKSIASVPIWKI